MAASRGNFAFLRGRYARVLTLVLIAQAAGLLAISRQEKVPLVKPLDDFPQQVPGWTMVRQDTLDAPTLEVLKADDTLSRVYMDGQGRAAMLFVAYFKSQRTGQAPHSPKNCLPGNGWVPEESAIVPVAIPGAAPIRVNRYIIAKGDEKSVVYYWYQSQQRVIASEYAAKIYLVADAIRYNRTDTALVRVLVPTTGDAAQASQAAERFIQAIFMPLRGYFPS